MIPITLTIKGLYSYQKAATIHFEPLTSAGLFGIFGAVGSGKSSILEAITFALYGETERLNNRDGRGYNMMNLKSNEMLIDFEFTSGSTKEKYKFTVGCKRNKKRYNETTAFERKAYQWMDNVWQPIDRSATDILGLSYDNFKRTIIIPQGKFQEFLQLKEAERVQMLKEIFNLEKFELGPKVGSLTKENDLRVSNTEGQMQNLPVYDQDILQQNEEAIATLQALYELQENQLKKKIAEEKSYELLKELFNQVHLKTHELKQLQENEQQFIQLEKRVSEYETCEKLFSNLFENKERIESALKIQKENFATKEKESIAIEKRINDGEATINELKDSYTTKEILLKKAEELEKIISIKELTRIVAALEKRIENGEVLIKSKTDEYDKQSKEFSALQNTITAKEQILPDTSLLVELSNWFAKKNQLNNEIEKISGESKEAANNLQAIVKNIEHSFKAFPKEINFISSPLSLNEVKLETEKAIIQYETDLQKCKDELAHLQLSQKLQEYAKDLQPGKECPLCGSVHHPHILSGENADEKIKIIKKGIKEIEDDKNKVQQTLLTLAGMYADYDNTGNFIKEKNSQLLQINGDWLKHSAAFSFEGFTAKDELIVVEKLKEAQDLAKQLSILRKQSNIFQSEIENSRKIISDYKEGVEKLKNEKATSAGQVNLLQQQIILHETTLEIVKEATILQSAIGQLQKKYKEITQQYEVAQRELQDNHTKAGTIKGQIEEIKNQSKKDSVESGKVNEHIYKLLKENNYIDEGIIKNILSEKINMAIEKEKINNYRVGLNTAVIRLKEAGEKVKGKEYNQQLHIELVALIEKLSTEQKVRTEHLITLKNDFQQLTLQMDERQKLQVELDRLMERSTNLKMLSNLFRSSGFVNYVSSVYLQNLVNAANQRFYKMTRQQLQLELTADNAFQVRDFLNNGEVRNIKTLSGGQTFQAALALALALADNIQHLLRAKENFFFMDEGFGSLDKNALSIVFETLQGLKKENRIVGVISHIEEMQHEISVSLSIENDPETGSAILKNWESKGDF